MANPYRDGICRVCGRPTRARARKDLIMRCAECGIAAAARQNMDLHRKEGYYYAQWVWCLGKWVRGLEKTVPPVSAAERERRAA